MLSKNNRQLIEVAHLGLVGEKKALFDFLKKIATNEINKNHYEIYNALMKLLSNNKQTKFKVSHTDSANVIKNNYHINISNIWLPLLLQKRVDRLLQYFKKIEKSQDEIKLNRIILYGPPGTGKTTLGFYIAERLKLPIRYVKVTDVMSSRLGETMKNISDIFQSPGKEVIFIDEFDAFGKTRLDNNDVGELKRIVSSIVQTLDFSTHDKVVIVATNLVNTIDSAILRRFPFKIEVGVLSEVEKKDFFIHFIKNGKNTKATLANQEWNFLFSIFNLLGLNTIDELRGVVEKAKMEMLLDNRNKINYKDFIEVLLFHGYLAGLKNIKTQNKKLLSKLLREIERIGYSKTTVASMIGVHRNTYLKYSSKK